MSREHRARWKRQFAAVQATKQPLLGVSVPRNTPVLDHITITVAYAKSVLNWTVVFNIDDSDMPPDFVFDEGDESFTTLEEVESLKRWNAENESSLLDIVLELRDKYRIYSKRKAEDIADERLKFELETTLANGEIYVKNDEQIKLPGWSHDMCLAEYVPIVEQLLNTKISALQKRAAMMSSLRDHFGVPLEYDSILFHRIAFFVDADKHFSLIVHFSLPVDFPTESPSIQLQATTCHGVTRPTSTTYTNPPYSPRWKPDEVATRMKLFIVEKLREFKESCQEAAAHQFALANARR